MLIGLVPLYRLGPAVGQLAPPDPEADLLASRHALCRPIGLLFRMGPARASLPLHRVRNLVCEQRGSTETPHSMGMHSSA